MYFGYIYKITNKINGLMYVGKHAKPIFDESYWGSGTILWNAYRKYGKNNFVREVIEFCDSESDLNNRERFWIRELNTIRPNGYNITEGGEGVKGLKFDDKTKLRISRNRKGKCVGESHHWYGKHLPVEMRLKISNTLMGKPSWNKGIACRPETKTKISDCLKHYKHYTNGTIDTMICDGNPIPDGFYPGRSKLRGRTAHNKGKPMSDEQKEKLRLAVTGTEPRRTLIYQYDYNFNLIKIHNSINSAARSIGVSSKVMSRLLKNAYKNNETGSYWSRNELKI